MKRIIMVQQMSGLRGDGRWWPPVGVEFEVSDDEARQLTHMGDNDRTPIAKYAETRMETADAPAKTVETREDKTEELGKGGTLPKGPTVAENRTTRPEPVAAAKPESPRPGPKGTGRPRPS